MSCLCQGPFCWPSGFCRGWLGSKHPSPLLGGTLRNGCISPRVTHHLTQSGLFHLFTGVWSCPWTCTQHFMLIKAEISRFSARMVLAASQSWLIFSPWNKLAACRRPYEHNGYIFHNTANTDILLWHIKVQQSTFSGEWSVLCSWTASFQHKMPKIKVLMLPDGNTVMESETHLTLQHYQHVQCHPKLHTKQCFPSALGSWSQLNKEEKLPCMFTYSLPSHSWNKYCKVNKKVELSTCTLICL